MDLAKVAFEIAGVLMPLDQDDRADVLNRVDGLLHGFESVEMEPAPKRKEKPAKSAPKAATGSAYEPMAQKILAVVRHNPNGIAPKEIAAALGTTTQESQFKGATRLLTETNRVKATGQTATRKFYPKEVA